MYIMSGLIISVAFLILLTLGIAAYKFFSKKQMVEQYYTPLDRVFGQTPIEHREEKVEKKEEEEGEGDDKDKNSKVKK